MAPLAVIEYVVVHELAHLKVRNHSPAFWQAVSEIMPAYQQHRRWLKSHGPLLTLD
jgi:predicted metal-dependent hydrolase